MQDSGKVAIRSEVVKCRFCGQAIKGNYIHKDEMLRKRLCFSCFFWVEALGDPNMIIVDGVCYSIGPENQRRGMRGHGGATFHIKFLLSGKTVTSTNLWVRGEIPFLFRIDNPDTAEFVTKGD